MAPLFRGHVSFFGGVVYFLNLCPPLHNICAYSIFPLTLQLWLPLIGICRSTLHLRTTRRPKRSGVAAQWSFVFVCVYLENPGWTWIKMTPTFCCMFHAIVHHLFSSFWFQVSFCSSPLGNLTVALRRSSFCKPSTARCVSLGGKTCPVQGPDSDSTTEPQTLMECPHARQANSLLPPNLNESHTETEL